MNDEQMKTLAEKNGMSLGKLRLAGSDADLLRMFSEVEFLAREDAAETCNNVAKDYREMAGQEKDTQRSLIYTHNAEGAESCASLIRQTHVLGEGVDLRRQGRIEALRHMADRIKREIAHCTASKGYKEAYIAGLDRAWVYLEAAASRLERGEGMDPTTPVEGL